MLRRWVRLQTSHVQTGRPFSMARAQVRRTAESSLGTLRPQVAQVIAVSSPGIRASQHPVGPGQGTVNRHESGLTSRYAAHSGLAPVLCPMESSRQPLAAALASFLNERTLSSDSASTTSATERNEPCSA